MKQALQMNSMAYTVYTYELYICDYPPKRVINHVSNIDFKKRSQMALTLNVDDFPCFLNTNLDVESFLELTIY